MSKRVIFIGINPSSKETRKSSTLDTLGNWCMFFDLEHYSFMNCIPSKTGQYKITDVNFDLLLEATSDYDRVVALGNFASDALKRIKKDHFKLPHPSPRNRVMNDKKKVQEILQECKEYIG